MDQSLKENEPTHKSTEDGLSFLGSDPGAVQYGNFINYYSFHGPENRIKNLTPEMFPLSDEHSYVCLDIGCNTGILTQALHKYLTVLFPNKDIYILGIDIDPLLIKRAIELNTTNYLSFCNIDIMDESCEHFFKKYLKKHNKTAFDVIFCFSVTMWIHLNHGDDGLLRFIKLTNDNTRAVIIEPQPWRCYKTAIRRMRRSNANFPLFKTLKIRENVEITIESIFEENNFKKAIESSPSAWNRRVLSFQSTTK